VSFATPGYFSTMAIPLRTGRSFASGDLATGVPPVVISHALARSLFGDGDPLGRRVRFARYGNRYPSYEIVGVAGDVLAESIQAGSARTIFFPILGDFGRDTTTKVRIPYIPGMSSFVVRGDLLPTVLLPEIRRAVRELDPQLPITRVRTLDQIVDAATARARLLSLLLSIAAAAAMFLGVIGVYGVANIAVTQRKHEIGIRMALGASPTGISSMVLSQAIGVAIAGTIVGLGAALALTRVMRRLLYETPSTDPVSFSAMVCVVFVVSVFASWLPARRAAQIDPMTVLRSE
jgi:ABC-type antimicrobial peptide transport system permease subunit